MKNEFRQKSRPRGISGSMWFKLYHHVKKQKRIRWKVSGIKEAR